MSSQAPSGLSMPSLVDTTGQDTSGTQAPTSAANTLEVNGGPIGGSGAGALQTAMGTFGKGMVKQANPNIGVSQARIDDFHTIFGSATPVMSPMPAMQQMQSATPVVQPMAPPPMVATSDRRAKRDMRSGAAAIARFLDALGGRR